MASLNKRGLLFALPMACAFAGLTLVMFRLERVDVPFVFLLPGLFLGMVSSGNVHGMRPGIAVLGNFIFYFGISYLVWVLWERHTQT